MTVFETARLVIRRAEDCDEDVEHLLALWNDPAVMTNVGFPRGLGITAEKIRAHIQANPAGEYDQWLVVVERATGALIGECKLGAPDATGLSGTDVKLRPAFWRRGFGKEIKQGLLDHLFTHTVCRAVRATPNKANIASQKMQEAVGGVRVGEGIWEPAPEQRALMTAVPHYIYEVSRETWERRRAAADEPSGG
jgi:RimJ/RimL family protein N-acetyltransferase